MWTVFVVGTGGIRRVGGCEMKIELLIEIGDLLGLEKAIAAFERGHTVFEEDEKTVVALAKMVVAEARRECWIVTGKHICYINSMS